jgi:hypothetical protein
VGHAFVPWWTSCLVTRAWMIVLRPWRPPQLVLLLLGTSVACVLILPYSNALTLALQDYFAQTGVSPPTVPAEHLEFWSYAVRASIVWIIVNLIFDRWVGLPRYRYDDGPDAPRRSQPQAFEHSGTGETGASDTDPDNLGDLRPRFLGRLPANLTATDIVLLKAEQHYVQAHTRDRRFMTLYRFSDAIAELGDELGLQVHRSFWINKDAVEAVRKGDRKMQLDMVDGTVVPVSGPNHALVYQLARERGLPIKPITRGNE